MVPVSDTDHHHTASIIVPSTQLTLVGLLCVRGVCFACVQHDGNVSDDLFLLLPGPAGQVD